MKQDTPDRKQDLPSGTGKSAKPVDAGFFIFCFRICGKD
jgi:hypothetical protein